MRDKDRNLCYNVPEQQLNYDDARSHCQSNGGDLVIADSDNKKSPVKRLYLMSYHLNIGVDVWVGLKDAIGANNEADYKWVNGQTNTYNNWASGQPSMASKRCVIMKCNYFSEFYDRDCSDLNHFVCEKGRII